MKVFYINSKPKYNLSPEIHQKGCRYLQKFETEKSIGNFATLTQAISEAQKIYPDVTNCDTCCREFIPIQ